MTEEDKAYMESRMAEALPAMRKHLKLSQSDLESLSGVSRSVISNIERGKRAMRWDTFVAITAVFRANPTCDNLLEAFGVSTSRLKKYFNVEG